MGTEIERKFLVKENCKNKLYYGLIFDTHQKSKEKLIFQNYLKLSNPEIRLRHSFNMVLFSPNPKKVNEEYQLTIKSGSGIKRKEWEFKIPVGIYWLLSVFTKRTLEKNRHPYIDENGQKWEIDHYPATTRRPESLMLAEIELDSEDQEVVKPYWLGEEVTNDPKYKNVNLAK